MRITENMGLTTREPERLFAGMMTAMGDSPSDPVSSNNKEDGDDEDDGDTLPGKLSEDDEPTWVVGTISRMVQQRMERFQQK